MGELIKMLPSFYYENNDNTDVLNIQNGIEVKLNELKFAQEDLLNQIFVDTATWGLNWWEKIVGLNVDITRSNDFRRERIKAKIRGTGTITKQMIIETAISYSNGEVEVIEDTANYRFIIKFIGTKGVPANLSDLRLTIEEIKPAHLSYTFEYSYLSWSEFDNYNKTFDAWDVLNSNWNAFEVYREVV